MITTTSNKTRILAKKLAITPLILGALFLFSTKIKAQQERPGDNVKVGFTVPGTDNLGKHPYVQIDGKEYPSDILTNISPSCIAGQATYLKDNAILRYGPTAADGAVIITTHKGGIKYITATEKENLRKESLAKTGFYHRITLKNEDGSSFDKLFINFPNNKGTMNASNKKDCKVGFLVRNKLYNEDQIDEVENFLKTHSRGESGVGDNKIGHVPGVDLSSYDIIFYFK
jgi:hypothetical protein